MAGLRGSRPTAVPLPTESGNFVLWIQPDGVLNSRAEGRQRPFDGDLGGAKCCSSTGPSGAETQVVLVYMGMRSTAPAVVG